MHCPFGVISKKSLPNFKSQTFYPLFSSKSFTVFFFFLNFMVGFYFTLNFFILVSVQFLKSMHTYKNNKGTLKSEYTRTHK